MESVGGRLSVLHLHRAERADTLAAALAGILAEPPTDPFIPDLVAVPTRGVERWLAQRLAHALGTGRTERAEQIGRPEQIGRAGRTGRPEHPVPTGPADGVCAHVSFPSPGALLGQVLAAGGGVAFDEDPWHPDRAVWPLLAVIDECAPEPWCAALGRHLGVGEGAEDRRGRRFGAAAHLAGLFHAYGRERPELIRAWSGDVDADGAGGHLTAELTWQAELWRRLRERLAVPSPAERLPAACARLRADPGLSDLPERLSLFGPTRLTAADLDVLDALAAGRAVHLWLPHPSPVLWERIAGLPVAGVVRRQVDPAAGAARHPLLASLGRDSRELQVRLAGLTADRTDEHLPGPVPPDTLLGRLQRQLHEDAPATGDLPELDPADRSVAVHACHGRARQVEVLREVLLHLLTDDPTLQPRDVLVLCPDIETFAPLITAAFGLLDVDGQAGREEHPGHRLRVRLADRSLRQTNPVLAVLADLLDLADARLTASQLLDLASTPPVRRRFGFDEDELEQLARWVADAGIRWGLGPAQRAAAGLPFVTQNTWLAGLNRILLGAAMSGGGEHWLDLALPLDGVDSTGIDLAGRLAELVDRLTAALAGLSGARPLREWTAGLESALDLLTDTAEADAWQSVQARRVLRDVLAAAGGQDDTSLTVEDVRALLAGRLQGRPTRAGFRTGHLTMCSLVPMRSVPHRVVCLLGLDDGAFPRGAGQDGDDLLLRTPLVGERDRRSEDRQVLLDAALAARDHLVVLYSGADERTNTPRPPAVPVGELLDALDATARTGSGRVRDRIVVRHPLQPFDRRNFTAGELGGPGPFSHDRSALLGARAAAGERHPAPAFLPGPLPPAATGDVIELDALLRFLDHPVKGFVRQRLEVFVPAEEDHPDDRIPLELDGLTRWGIGEQLLTDALGGVDADRRTGAEWRRGRLPPGPLGSRLLTGIGGEVDPLAAAAERYREATARSVDVAVSLPDGRRLVGAVEDLHGSTVLRATFSRLRAKQRLRAWVQLLALSAGAGQPPAEDQPWQAVTVGRSGGRALVLGLTDPGPAAAAAELAALVDLVDRGMCAPLPLSLDSSVAYAEARRRGRNPVEAREEALRRWSTFDRDDPYHVLVFGADPELADLAVGPPADDERWGEDEPTRFGALSCRLWLPLLAAEERRTP